MVDEAGGFRELSCEWGLDMECENEDFRNACDAVIGRERNADGIGTLGEKTVHAVLKRYFAPDVSCHEQRCGGFVADILFRHPESEQLDIFEIQTRGFDRLRRKLDAFLEEGTVTVVYPAVRTKWISWIDPETGEALKKRKSPRKGQGADVFPELYKIKSQLLHPNFRLHIVLLDIVEYRNLNGWSADRKKGSTRFDGIPTELAAEIVLEKPADYLQLLPPELPEVFSARDLSRLGKLRLTPARTTLNILHHMGVVERVGKDGRAYLYRVVNEEICR